MTIVRNVRTQDSPAFLAGALRRWQIRDEILTPITTGKTFALGETWAGALRPKIDAFVAAVEPLTRGFALGHIVGAESAPGGLALGQLWEGFIGLRDALASAVVSGERPAGGEQVDLDEIFTELESMRRAVGSLPEANDFTELENSLRGLQRARDAVDAQVRAARTTRDAQNFLARSRDANAAAFAQISEGTAKRYGTADQRVAPARDSTGEVRDALHAAGHATDMRTKVSALNDAHAAFWRARTRDHLDNLLPRSGTRGALERQVDQGGGSGALTPAEINRRNREHYARR
jgi:hypothetical protein